MIMRIWLVSASTEAGYPFIAREWRNGKDGMLRQVGPEFTGSIKGAETIEGVRTLLRAEGNMELMPRTQEVFKREYPGTLEVWG